MAAGHAKPDSAVIIFATVSIEYAHPGEYAASYGLMAVRKLSGYTYGYRIRGSTKYEVFSIRSPLCYGRPLGTIPTHLSPDIFVAIRVLQNQSMRIAWLA